MTDLNANLDGPRQQRLQRLRLRHLHLLDAIAQTGSLSAAAARLTLSQPAASQLLQELEAAFGVTLVHRSAQGSALSADGEVVLQRLRVALAAVAGASQALATSPARAVVRVGMVPAAGATLLPPLLRYFDGRPSAPHLCLEESTVPALVRRLRDGAIDCMIGPLEMDEGQTTTTQDLVLLPLARHALVVAAAPDHPLCEAEAPLSAATLARARWLLAPRDTSSRRAFEHYFLNAGLAPPLPEVESFLLHTNLSALRGTRLLTIALSPVVAHYQQLGLVRQLPLQEPFTARAMVFARRHDVLLPALDEIAAVLKQAAVGI